MGEAGIWGTKFKEALSLRVLQAVLMRKGRRPAPELSGGRGPQRPKEKRSASPRQKLRKLPMLPEGDHWESLRGREVCVGKGTRENTRDNLRAEAGDT